jgi:hypothetical protein
MKVRLGEWNTRDEREPYPMMEVEIEDVTLHADFNPDNLQNDVAIIKLARPIAFGTSRPHINPACLPKQGASFVGQM